MPKTAINEDGHVFLGKCKVWLAGQGLVPAPPGYLVFLEERKQLEFRGLVALATDGLHYFFARLVEHFKTTCTFSARSETDPGFVSFQS